MSQYVPLLSSLLSPSHTFFLLPPLLSSIQFLYTRIFFPPHFILSFIHALLAHNTQLWTSDTQGDDEGEGEGQ